MNLCEINKGTFVSPFECVCGSPMAGLLVDLHVLAEQQHMYRADDAKHVSLGNRGTVMIFNHDFLHHIYLDHKHILLVNIYVSVTQIPANSDPGQFH